MDIDKKIKELQRDLERLEAELDSINRANYDGHETKTLMAKEKQIREKQSELLKYKKAKEMASTKDSMEILRLSGYTMDYSKEELRKYARQYGDPDLINHVEKLSPTSPEIGARIRWFKTYWDGRNINGKIVNKEIARAEAKDADWDARVDFLEDKIRKLSKYGDRDSQQRLKGYQEELKAIQAKQSKQSKQSKDGYKMEDPKEIEAAIKKVKASGHPNPQYLAGLERALEIAKRERGMKDSCGEKVYTKGTEDNDATKEGAIKEYGAKEGSFEDTCTRDTSVVWVKPSGINYKVGDIIQYKGNQVRVTKINGNVVEAEVMGKAEDACSTKDDDASELERLKELLKSLKKEGGERGFGMTPIMYRDTQKKIKELQKKIKSANDACTNKDSAIQKECNEILKLSGFIS